MAKPQKDLAAIAVVAFAEELILHLRRAVDPPVTVTLPDRLRRFILKQFRQEGIRDHLAVCIGGEELTAILTAVCDRKQWKREELTEALKLTGTLISKRDIRKEPMTEQPKPKPKSKPSKPAINVTKAPVAATAASLLPKPMQPNVPAKRAIPPGQISTEIRSAPSTVQRPPVAASASAAPPVTPAPKPRLPLRPRPTQAAPALVPAAQSPAIPVDVEEPPLKGDLLESLLGAQAREHDGAPPSVGRRGRKPKEPSAAQAAADPFVRLRALEVMLQVRRLQLGSLPFGHPSHTAVLIDVDNIAEEVAHLANRMHIPLEIPTQKQIADEERIRKNHIERVMGE